MSGRALSEEAMLASLQGLDMPVAAAGGPAADIAVSIGLGGLAALLVAGLLRLLSRHRRPAPRSTLSARVADARRLPEAERRVLLLHLLRDRAPERYAAVAQDLYRPGSALTADRLEQELAALA